MGFFFSFLLLFPNHTYCAKMWLRFSLSPFSTYKHRMLWSGVFLPTSSRASAGTVGTCLQVERQGLWSGWGLGYPVKGPPPLGAACLGYCLPHPLFRGRLFWKATTSGDSERLFLFFLQVSGILLHSQLLWASKFSQKSPCKSHQITQREMFGGMGLR